MIDAYITKNPLIHRVTWILDIRRDPDVLDKTVLEWIRHIQIPFSIILTKSDKENRSFGLGKKDKLRKEFQTNDIFIFSAKDGYGSEEVLSHLFTTFI
jgi:GTP-binding protein